MPGPRLRKGSGRRQGGRCARKEKRLGALRWALECDEHGCCNPRCGARSYPFARWPSTLANLVAGTQMPVRFQSARTGLACSLSVLARPARRPGTRDPGATLNSTTTGAELPSQPCCETNVRHGCSSILPGLFLVSMQYAVGVLRRTLCSVCWLSPVTRGDQDAMPCWNYRLVRYAPVALAATTLCYSLAVLPLTLRIRLLYGNWLITTP